MPRRKTKHNKIQTFEDYDGWTHVVRGPRLPSSELRRINEKTENSDDIIARYRSTLTLSSEQIWASYSKSECYWGKDPLRHRFEEIYNSQIIKSSPNIVINNAMVLGLGTLSSDSLDCSSMHQLVLFEHWIKFLRTKHAISKIYFQDPHFLANDRKFLEALGYSVVDDPEAYLLLTPTTFLFAPFLPWTIMHTFFYVVWPALYIGSNFTNVTTMDYSREYQTILRSSVVQKYYSSCKRAELVSLDEDGHPLEDIEKHSDWLASHLVHWSPENEQQEGDSLDDLIIKPIGAPKGRSKLKSSILQLNTESIENFSFRAGPGEWRPDGYVFDPEIWAKIQKAQQQRAMQPQ